MPVTVRTDQTLTGKVVYSKAGNPAAHPSNVFDSYSVPGVASAVLGFIDANTASITLHPVAPGVTTFKLTGSDGTVTTDEVTVVAAPLVGTLTWNPPTPA